MEKIVHFIVIGHYGGIAIVTISLVHNNHSCQYCYRHITTQGLP